MAELCDVKPHVLRYWETEFPTLKPVKRRGNRRYYQRADVLVSRQIRGLRYEEGYTIGGARLRIDTEKQAPAAAKAKAASAASVPAAAGIDVALLRQVREELESVLALLRS